MKNYTSLGVIIGIAFAFALVIGDWSLLLVVIILGAVGGVIGAHFDGRIDLREICSAIIGKNQG